MLMRFSILWLLICCPLSLAGAAAPPYIVDAASQLEPLGLHLDFLEDKSGQLRIEQVASTEWQNQFVSSRVSVPSFGRTKSIYWFRLVIESRFSDTQEQFLGIKTTSPDRIDVYLRQADGWQHTQTGRDFPFQQRPLQLTYYYFPIELDPGQSQEIYIRLDSPVNMSLPVELLNVEQLAVEQFRISWLPFICYGALVILGLYNLIIFFSVRNSIYLYYIGFNITLILVDMQLKGYAFQYLWPDWPAMNQILPRMIVYAYQIGFLLLTQKLLNIKRYSPKLNHVVNGFILLLALSMIFSLFLPNNINRELSSFFSLTFVFVAFIASIYVLSKGARIARYLVTGGAFMVIATFVLVLTYQGVMPINFWTQNSALISAIIFSVLISFAFVDRIKVLRAEQQAAHQQALQEAQEKRKIAEKNMQLQRDNIRMATELDVTRQLQTMVLPSPTELSQVKSLDIACWMQPAEEVGGDYYDVLQYQDKVIIGMGDVTGHGLASGVLMIMVQTAVRALSISDSADFFQVLNQTIYDNVQRMGIDKDMTLVILDYKNNKLSISGQHEDVLIIRGDGKLEYIDTVDLGFMLGVTPDIRHLISSRTIELSQGDGIVLYTDGITEAFDADSNQYGLDRLCEVTQQHWSKSAQDIKNEVLKDFQQYIGDKKIADDCTLMIIKQLAA